jgi:anti-anti-sigma factor
VASTTERPVILGVDKKRFGTTVVVRLSGELDLASGEELEAAVRERENAEHVILDLESLGFIDSAGLRVIYELWAESRNDGFNLAIVGAQGPVRRVMSLTGLDEILPLAD